MTAEAPEAEPNVGGDASALLTVVRFEGTNRLRITGVLVVLFSLFGGLYLWLGPQLVAGEAVQDLLASIPPVLNELMNFESLTSLAGLLASEFYTFGWIVGFGGYLAYTAAGTVAGDLEEDRMDLLLSGPVARRSVLLGKYLALLVPIVVVNLVVPPVLYAGSVAVDAPLPAEKLAILHALSIPYLLLWGAVGLLIGVVVRRVRTAGRLALGIVFAAWLFEAVIGTTDYAWTGAVSPMRYLDPPAVLVDGTYDVVGAGVLTSVALATLGVSLLWFQRHDI